MPIKYSRFSGDPSLVEPEAGFEPATVIRQLLHPLSIQYGLYLWNDGSLQATVYNQSPIAPKDFHRVRLPVSTASNAVIFIWLFRHSGLSGASAT